MSKARRNILHEPGGVSPLEIKTPNQARRPALRRETRGLAGKGFPTGPVRRRFSNGAGFTLIELLVVISIIALLMAILLPVLGRAKKQAKAVICQSNLKQWGLMFSMYTQDNNGYFMEGAQGSSKGYNRWVKALGAYHKWDSDFACCPSATQPWYTKDGVDTGLKGTYRGSTSAWGYYGPPPCKKVNGSSKWLRPFKGSYGINGWCNNPDPGKGHKGKPEKYHWRSPNVKGAGYVPLFMGAQRYNMWPEHIDMPPDFDGQTWSGGDHMRRPCLNRHDGFVNGIFLDFSLRKIGLKELWKLKWHRKFDITGGPTQTEWPDWIKGFKDY